ncbi:PH domain-containing protein [Demequina capsici]|uniref:PH domain-containing protein n=1 Tax=Demequina capsici TaxID=3075620 RepID=A0AA96FCG0_9MICO|nr:PH domain-containing protein [Demequina sp. PMTSA13]WNM27203.1 PH domain-containing protein [Demequina sp. PMTSA13]
MTRIGAVRVTLRGGWVQFVGLALCSAGFALVGWSMVDYSEDLVGEVMGWVIAIPSTFFMLRAPFVRVVADSGGVSIHGWASRRRIAWAQVAAVDSAVLQDRILWFSQAPVLTIVGRDEPLILQQIYHYEPREEPRPSGRVMRQVGQLREFLKASRVGG